MVKHQITLSSHVLPLLCFMSATCYCTSQYQQKPFIVIIENWLQVYNLKWCLCDVSNDHRKSFVTWRTFYLDDDDITITHTHAHAHTCTCTTHTHRRTCMHAHAHAHTHTDVHTHTHACTCTTHTHAHTERLIDCKVYYIDKDCLVQNTTIIDIPK